VATIAPACKLAVAAVRAVISGPPSAAATHDSQAGEARSSSSSSSKAWRVVGVLSDLLGLIMRMADSLSVWINNEYTGYRMLAHQQEAESFRLPK
jgi:hypothetical protein